MTDDAGGPEWERNQAAKRMAAAVTAGDADAIEESADRLGDAVVNGAIARLFPTFEHTLSVVIKKEIGGIAKDMADQAQLHGERYDYILRELAAFLVKEDGSRAAYSAQQDSILVELGGLKSGQSELQAEFRQVAEIVDELVVDLKRLDDRDQRQYDDSKIDREELRTRLTQVEADFHAYIAAAPIEARQAAIAKLEAHDQDIRAMKEFFTSMLSPEEQASKDDAAVEAAADLREFLVWFRAHRDALLTGRGG